MKQSTGNHPDEETIREYSLGRLPSEKIATLANHLKQCADCEKRLEAVFGRNTGLHKGTASADVTGAWDSSQLPVQSLPTLFPEAAGSTPGPSPFPGRIGDYEILSEIARGGMGVVYKARHLRLGRIAALKLIKAGELADADDVRRFRKEAEAASQLDHPNIVPLFEIGQHAGQHYMTLAYIEGMTLSSRLQDSPLAPKDAALLLIQIANAIEFAHQKGIIHRDIKPQNVLLTSDGLPKVTDFGLAKSTRADSSLTGTGAIVGTPSYMPPEQALGDNSLVGVQSDVYSLGATLFHLLTGRPPFVSATPLETLKQVLDCEPVSPRTLNPAVPSDLEAICLKALEKQPAKRYPTAQQFSEDLGRFTRGEATQARPLRAFGKAWRWCGRNRLLAGAAGAVSASLLLGAIISGVLAFRANHFATKAGLETVAANVERDRANLEKEKATRQLYFTTIAREEQRIKEGITGRALDRLRQVPLSQRGWEHRYLSRVAEGSMLVLRGHRDAVTAIAFTPDGEQLVSGSGDGTIRTWNVRTGKQVKQIDAHRARMKTLAISPDGKYLASGAIDNTIKIWELSTGSLKRTIRAHEQYVYSVGFSPDGKKLVSGGGDNLVKVWEVSTGKELLTLRGHSSFVPSVAFSVDGQLIASSDREETVKLWDAHTGREVRTLKSKEKMIGEVSHVASVSFSPDGGRLAVAWETGAVIWNMPTGEERRTDLKTATRVSCTAFSPNGIHLACGTTDGNGKLAKIIIFDSRFGNVRYVLSGHQADIRAVAFSPDGSLMASADDVGAIRIWDARAGNLPLTFLTGSPFCPLAISDDGRKLIGGAGPNVIKLWDSVTGVELQKLEGHGEEASAVAVSPHSRYVACTSARKDTATVWELPTGKVKHTLGGETHKVSRIAFSPARDVVATGASDGSVHLWDLESGNTLQSFGGHPSFITSLAFSRDGTLIAAGYEDRTLRVWELSANKLLFSIEAFEFRGYLDWVSALAFHPKQNLVVTGNRHGALKCWDATSGRLARTMSGHEGPVRSLVFSPDGSRIISAGDSSIRRKRVLRFWDFDSGSELLAIDAHEHDGDYSHFDIALAPDGERLFSNGRDGLIKCWDARMPSQTLAFHPHPSSVYALSLNATGSRLATGTFNGVIKIWDTDNASALIEFDSGEHPLYALAFNERGTVLYSQDYQGKEGFWDLKTHKKLPGKPIGERFQTHFSARNGKLSAFGEGNSAILTVQSDNSYDPFGEFFALKENWGATWNLDDARAARGLDDWFANQYFLALNLGAADRPIEPNTPNLSTKLVAEDPSRVLQQPFDANRAGLHQAAWAKRLNIPVTKTNSLGMEFRLIPPGEFTMGLPAEYAESIAKLGRPDDQHWQQMGRSSSPPHQVRITRPFYLATCEVTQSQFEKVMGYNPSAYASTGSEKDRVSGLDTSTRPVEQIGFVDAAEFCMKLAQLEGRSPCYEKAEGAIKLSTGNGYRLPTEAEWEWACGAGATTASYQGRLDSQLGTVAVFNANSDRMTQPVGQLRSNAFGLFDMHGNVWERCQDGFDPNAYASRKLPISDDPSAPISEALGVCRGGSWFDSPAACRTGLRFSFYAAQKLSNCGFRVAISVP